MKYTVDYAKDPQWDPSYAGDGMEGREYMDILPNKFDLLPGESESVLVYANTGRQRSMTPAIAIAIATCNDLRIAKQGASQIYWVSQTLAQLTASFDKNLNRQ